MVVNRANLTGFTITPSNLQNKATVFSGKASLRRFDTLELSSFFKRVSDESKNKSCAAEIQKMLSSAQSNDNAECMSKGIAGYAYMAVSAAREAMRAEANIAKFNYYSEEKSYYQSLLNEADGNTTSNTARQAVAYDDYEYICRENEPVDREKAIQALENVQNRIDCLVNDAQIESGKTDMQTFNKCAVSFTKAFGVENPTFTLSESNFNKLFGKVEATEENYIQKYSDKAKGLWKYYNSLEECLSRSTDKIRFEISGGEKSKSIKNVFAEAYGNSFADIMDLINELQLTDETE